MRGPAVDPAGRDHPWCHSAWRNDACDQGVQDNGREWTAAHGALPVPGSSFGLCGTLAARFFLQVLCHNLLFHAENNDYAIDVSGHGMEAMPQLEWRRHCPNPNSTVSLP